MRTGSLRNSLAISVLLLVMACTAMGKIIYVNADANGLNDGSSWADAYNYLQDALTDANSGAKPVEIQVAEGNSTFGGLCVVQTPLSSLPIL